MYASRCNRWGSVALRGGKTHAVEGEEAGVQEGGSRSPRGRTRALATHTRTRIPALRTHAVYIRRCNTGVCTDARARAAA